MSINKVDSKSFSYKLLWYSIKIWHHLFYYQKIEVINRDRIPKTGALLFTPNHQNALMDALAVLFSIKRTLVFLARADIFKKKFIAEILYFLRILPVFRPRDGQGEVKKNLETFKKTSEVLQKNLGLVIFPEGTHTDKQSLLPLKKGFVKIALQTEEANDFKLGIKLLPMAITYSNYEQCQSILSINFGHPIDLSPHYDAYREHPAKAFNAIRDELAASLKENMIHIEDDEYYETTEFLMSSFGTQIYNGNINNRILIGQYFLKRLDDWRAKNPTDHLNLHHQTKEFLELTKGFNKRQKIRTHNYSVSRLILNVIIFLLFAIILIPAMILQLPNYLISNIPATKIKDAQFHSSFRFVIGFLMVPIIFLIELFIFKWIFPEIDAYVFGLIYFFSIIIMSNTLSWMRNLYADLKISFYRLRHSQEYNRLRQLSINLLDTIKQI